MPDSVLSIITSYLNIDALVPLIKSCNRVLHQKLLKQGGISMLNMVQPYDNLQTYSFSGHLSVQFPNRLNLGTMAMDQRWL